MPALLHIPIIFSPLNPLHKYNDSSKKNSIYKLRKSQPINYLRTKVESFHTDRFKAEALRKNLPFSGVRRGKDGILVSTDRRVVVVKFNNGFNGLGGGGGGGGGGGEKINSETARVLGNLALAIILTYLTMSGQLGWLLDAIVSIWLLAVLVPIVGIGAFLWWAGRDIVVSSCPNCGNDFQVFKSTLNDEVQLCPFCSQPFSVEGDKFVRDPVTFSNQTKTFDQGFGKSSPRAKKGKGSSSVPVVDVEAEYHGCLAERINLVNRADKGRKKTVMGVTEELRWTAAKLINVGKFAVDSAVTESLKGGMQVYAIVKGKLKGKPSSGLPNSNKKQNSVLVEEMQAKLEKMRQDRDNVRHESRISTLRTEEQENLKQFYDEPLKSSSHEVTGRKRIFIRSRL